MMGSVLSRTSPAAAGPSAAAGPPPPPPPAAPPSVSPPPPPPPPSPMPRSTPLRPEHIDLPPPPTFPAFPAGTPSPSRDDQFFSAPSSPYLQFYTAPSSPATGPPAPDPTALATALALALPAAPGPSSPHPRSPVDEFFPTVDMAVDLAIDDDGLSTLEKIYLFSRSKAIYHRTYICHVLPAFLDQVSPLEAIEYVLPLLSGLAMDEDEAVKEALAAELVPVIWWFFTHCRVVPHDDVRLHDAALAPAAPTAISVQAFTPILGTLLLSSNPQVGGTARFAVVELLSRMRTADAAERAPPDPPVDFLIGCFGRPERELFQQEILQQVVIGMGRLDAEGELDDFDDADGARDDDAGQDARDNADDAMNPYFPPVASAYTAPSPSSSASTTPSSTTGSTASSSPSPPVLATLGQPLPPSYVQGSSSIHDMALETTPVPNPSPTPTAARLEPSAPRSAARGPLPGDWLPPAHPEHDGLPPPRNQPESPPSPPPLQRQLVPASDFIDDEDDEDEDDDVDGDSEQAAVGRLTSMSLMAAVAASGSLEEDTKDAFVKEVERVGRDSVYWVRREASFALGALAKVVPQEVVLSSLLPLFESLRRDPVWHVRHSALFALPAILSRLTPSQRRSLALETIVPLATDESPAVRSGVLEALGEVLYTFHEDQGGPPADLVLLFLGRREDKRVRDGQQTLDDAQDARDEVLNTFFGLSSPQTASSPVSVMESFWTDPKRPLICAFNIPAVAATLGRERWGELRQVYAELAENRAVNVRQTLAASVGDLAKIVGPENARRDLVGVWQEAVGSEDEDVRLKAIECVGVFVEALGGAERGGVVVRLWDAWRDGTLRGWRERAGIAGALVGLARAAGGGAEEAVRKLLVAGLEDGVAAVREAAVRAVPPLWTAWADRRRELRADLLTLATSASHRRRMTFVACQHALLAAAVAPDDAFWLALGPLADDPIVGVRIGLARLLGATSDAFRAPAWRRLAQRVARDPAPQVRAYLAPSPAARPPATATAAAAAAATFSRPPLPP